MCTCYPIINRVSELKVHIELTRFVQPEKIEIDANERAVNEKSQYCFFVCTTFDSFLNDLSDSKKTVFRNCIIILKLNFLFQSFYYLIKIRFNWLCLVKNIIFLICFLHCLLMRNTSIIFQNIVSAERKKFVHTF